MERYMERICCVDEKIWYSSSAFNGLYCLDLKTGSDEFVGFIPDEKVMEKGLYVDILYYKNNIILVPYNADGIAIYNINEKQFRKKYINEKEKFKYYKGLIDDDKLYLFPRNAKKALIYDFIKDELVPLDEVSKEIERYRRMDRVAYSVVKYKNFILFPVINTEYLAKYDIDTGNIEFLRLFENNKFKLCTAIVVDDSIYISCLNRAVLIQYDLCKNEFRYFDFENIYSYERTFVASVLSKYKDTICMFFTYTNKYIFFHLKSCKFYKKNIFGDLDSTDDLGMICELNSELALLPTTEREKLIVSDGRSYDVKDSDYLRRYFEYKNNTEKHIVEQEFFTFSDFINNLQEE